MKGFPPVWDSLIDSLYLERSFIAGRAVPKPRLGSDLGARVDSTFCGVWPFPGPRSLQIPESQDPFSLGSLSAPEFLHSIIYLFNKIC